MSVAIVLFIVLGALFALAFFTKRRFGVLGLALAAGSILSNLWSKDLTPLIRGAGLELISPPLVSVVAATVVLLPAVLLLFSGPSYRKTHHRIIYAGAFSLLALAFLLPILGDALVLEDEGKMIFDIVASYRVWIITGGIILAIVDVLTVRTRKEDKER